MHTHVVEYYSTIKMNAVSWGYGLEVKGSWYSSGGLEYISQNPHGCSKPHITHVSGNTTHSSGIYRQ